MRLSRENAAVRINFQKRGGTHDILLPMSKEPQKDPAAVSLGRRGGEATSQVLTPAERAASASNAAKALWTNLSPEERSAKAKKSAATRRRNAAAKARAPKAKEK